jgi:hypothetical protein
MQLARPNIRKTGVYAVIQKSADQAFSTVQWNLLVGAGTAYQTEELPGSEN